MVEVSNEHLIDVVVENMFCVNLSSNEYTKSTTGVIHRDIKPDNCILTRCGITSAQYDLKDATSWKVDDNLWDDEAIFNEKEWRMKLVDFGFARALTPAECGVLNGHQRRPSMSELIQRGITNEKSRRSSLGIEGGDGAVLEDTDDAAINDTSSKLRRKSILFTRRSNSLEEEETMPADDSSSSRRRKSSLFGRKQLNSIEKNLIRAMSALGTLDYAAPEIKNSRDKCDGDVALTDLVADYGLIADAYSVGCTIREILTGVPAKEAKNEMDFMTSHGNSIDFLALFFSCCTTTASNSSNRRKKRKRRYKWLDESPKHARELVLKMINTKIADRLTVPLAREEVWIKGGMSSDDPIVTLPVGDIPAGVNDPIEFLQCTTTME
jgi:serine/threonine protein kinase